MSKIISVASGFQYSVTLMQSTENYNRFIFIVPKKYSDIQGLVKEFHAISYLRERASDDKLLFEEYEVVYEDFWCLYGETDFADKTMLNRAIVEQMTPDEIMTVKVILELTHGNASYVITRSQDYKKSYTNKVTGANTVLNIAVKAADGNTRYLKPLECELEIKKILPKELSNYFFFDGERIEKMSKDIASGKKSKAFSEAVVGLTGLNATLSALNHLSPTKPNSVMKKFNENYRDASDGKLQSLTHQIESLQEKMDKATTRLSEVEDEIEATSGLKTKLEEEIKQYADGEQLQKDKEKLLRDVKKAQNLKSQFIKEVCKEFNANLTPFLSLSLTKKALETLSHNGLDNKDIPEMHSKTIHYLLEHGTCICGTRLDEGTIPYMKVKELLDYLPPQSIGVTVGQFKKDSRTYYLKPVSLFEEISNKLSLVSEQDETIIDLTENIDLITEKLSGNDVREQVRKISSQIQTCNKTLTERRRERDQLIHNQGGYETEIKQKENDRSELSLIDKNNRQLELYALLRDLFIQINGKVSWEIFLENHELTTELENLLFPDYYEDSYESVYRHELIDIINQNLNTLKEREQEVLRLRFGLDDGNPRILDEIAKNHNLTRERIRQIEARALRKMRHPILSKRLKGFYC